MARALVSDQKTTHERNAYIWDVFVSHNHRQKEWVREVVRQWRSLGLKVFLDEDDIAPGMSVVSGLEEGLRHSRHIVLIISPAAVRSKWVAMELSCGIYEDCDSSANRIIPLVLEPTRDRDIRLSIQSLNKIDLAVRNESERVRNYHRFLRYLRVTGDNLPPPPPWPTMNAKLRNREPSVGKGKAAGNADPIDRDRDFIVELTLETPIELFSESHKDALMKAISSILRVGCVKIKGIRSGSVIITLELTSDQVAVLVKAVNDGKLKRYRASKVELLEAENDSMRPFLEKLQMSKWQERAHALGRIARATGKVKWFDNKRGYGFIVQEKGKDVFVHHKSFLGKGFKTLQQGELVSFEILNTKNTPTAINVVKAKRPD